MSEELKRGIPKAVPTGELIKFTKKEQEKCDKDFEQILKSMGVLGSDESIEFFKCKLK